MRCQFGHMGSSYILFYGPLLLSRTTFKLSASVISIILCSAQMVNFITLANIWKIYFTIASIRPFPVHQSRYPFFFSSQRQVKGKSKASQLAVLPVLFGTFFCMVAEACLREGVDIIIRFSVGF